jgi:hypothetical protein
VLIRPRIEPLGRDGGAAKRGMLVAGRRAATEIRTGDRRPAGQGERPEHPGTPGPQLSLWVGIPFPADGPASEGALAWGRPVRSEGRLIWSAAYGAAPAPPRAAAADHPDAGSRTDRQPDGWIVPRGGRAATAERAARDWPSAVAAAVMGCRWLRVAEPTCWALIHLVTSQQIVTTSRGRTGSTGHSRVIPRE